MTRKHRAIESAVCAAFGLPRRALRGKRGIRPHCDARHLCWHLLAEAGLSRTGIAKHYGVSPSAVTQALGKVAALLHTDPDFSQKAQKAIKSNGQ